MGYLDRVRACTRHDPARYLPLCVERERLGWIRRDRLAQLLACGDTFRENDGEVALSPALRDPPARTEAVRRVVDALDAQGVLPTRYHEQLPVVRRLGESPRLLVERSAAALLGVRAFGVHVNGLVRHGPGPADVRVWVARRTSRVRVEPGKLDHLVAGGQPHGLGLEDNLAKEAWEEAGVPLALARTARPVGVFTYRLDTADGLKDDVLFLYDLELPRDFVPVSQDGELEEFELWPLERIEATLAEGDAFKFNVAPVLLDLLARIGRLGPDHPDYVEILQGLRT